MIGLPARCNTRADYDFIRTSQIEGWQEHWRQLLDGRHAVIDGDLVDDPHCRLFSLGFTVAEVEQAVGPASCTTRQAEWYSSHPDRYQLVDGVWTEIDGWRAGRDAADLARAVAAKMAEIEAESRRRQAENFTWRGNAYYADSWATKTIESCCSVASALGLASSDPIRVPYPLQPGYWMSADVDTGGNRVMIYLTVGDMRQLLAALYDRNGSVWGKEVVHKATVEAMAGSGATVAEIEAYNHLSGWE